MAEQPQVQLIEARVATLFQQVTQFLHGIFQEVPQEHRQQEAIHQMLALTLILRGVAPQERAALEQIADQLMQAHGEPATPAQPQPQPQPQAGTLQKKKRKG